MGSADQSPLQRADLSKYSILKAEGGREAPSFSGGAMQRGCLLKSAVWKGRENPVVESPEKRHTSQVRKAALPTVPSRAHGTGLDVLRRDDHVILPQTHSPQRTMR